MYIIFKHCSSVYLKFVLSLKVIGHKPVYCVCKSVYPKTTK